MFEVSEARVFRHEVRTTFCTVCFYWEKGKESGKEMNKGHVNPAQCLLPACTAAGMLTLEERGRG